MTSATHPHPGSIERELALDIASLLCSRLCHDLLSPVGALNNGLELLAEEKDPEMRQKCFELLEQSARISADKLRCRPRCLSGFAGVGCVDPARYGGPWFAHCV